MLLLAKRRCSELVLCTVPSGGRTKQGNRSANTYIKYKKLQKSYFILNLLVDNKAFIKN